MHDLEKWEKDPAHGHRPHATMLWLWYENMFHKLYKMCWMMRTHASTMNKPLVTPRISIYPVSLFTPYLTHHIDSHTHNTIPYNDHRPKNQLTGIWKLTPTGTAQCDLCDTDSNLVTSMKRHMLEYQTVFSYFERNNWWIIEKSSFSGLQMHRCQQSNCRR